MKIAIAIILILLFVFPTLANAGLLNEKSQIFGKAATLSIAAGFDTTIRAGSIVSIIIKAFLSLLGIIFIILIILSGYNIMTASGDEQKVEKAKDTIKRAVIGLIIIVSAYAITYFVFSNLPAGTGSTSGTGVEHWTP